MYYPPRFASSGTQGFGTMPPGPKGEKRPADVIGNFAVCRFAVPQHHAELIWLDPEEAGEAPQHQRREQDQRKPLVAETAAGQHGAELVLSPATTPQSPISFLRTARRRL